MQKQHYSKHSSRERRKKEERRRALEQQSDADTRISHLVCPEEESTDRIGKDQLVADLTASLFAALRINRKADFGVVKLCTLPLDDLIVTPSLASLAGLDNARFPMTLFECACILGGRDAIVAALIRCGADPSKRFMAAGLGTWKSSRKHSRFVRQLPLAYAVWLTSRIAELRSQRGDSASVGSTKEASHEPIASCQCGASVAHDFIISWPQCSHVCCEDCLWAKLSSDRDLQLSDCQCPTCLSSHADAGPCTSQHAPGEDYIDGHLQESWPLRNKLRRNLLDQLTETGSLFSFAAADRRRVESKERWLALPLAAQVCGQEAILTKKKTPRKERCSFKGLPMHELWRQNLGHSRETRQAALFKAAAEGDCGRLAALIEAGVDVDAENEYGQTALHTAAFYGNFYFVFDLIVIFGADWTVRDSSGCDIAAIASGGCGIDSQRTAAFESIASLFSLLSRCGGRTDPRVSRYSRYRDFPTDRSARIEAVDVIFRTFRGVHEGDANRYVPGASAVVTALVDDCIGHIRVPALSPCAGRCQIKYSDHPGSGSFYVDGLFSEEFLSMLSATHGSIPAAPATKESCSSRTYFFDATRVTARAIEAAVRSVLRAAAGHEDTGLDAGESNCVAVLPGMRFLHYVNSGGSLAAHVDLAKKDVISGLDSTHTFVIYLSDCAEGGETALLDCLCVPKSRSSDGELEEDLPHHHDFRIPAHMLEGRKVISAVQPRRGRLLVFQHLCPHLGNVVRDPPKLLLRGELSLRSVSSEHCENGTQTDDLHMQSWQTLYDDSKNVN